MYNEILLDWKVDMSIMIIIDGCVFVIIHVIFHDHITIDMYLSLLTYEKHSLDHRSAMCTLNI